MKKTIVCLALLMGSISLLWAWGAWGHQHINRAAVFALPQEMRPFFYNHIDFLTEEAVVPDLRKYSINDKAEFPRHYIDMEVYDSTGDVYHLPRTLQEMKARYADSFLTKTGILPWYILQMEDKLTKAFQNKRKTEILFLAADLAHYIGDAHMPLHTSRNHDGQYSGQKGIHAFWEGQLPETFGKDYNLYTRQARYISDITAETWAMIDSTHRLAAVLLAEDKALSAGMPKDKIYVLDAGGNIAKNRFGDFIHTGEYARLYHARLNGMIEKQLRGAIAEVSSYWYTAWVNAGKPDLSELDPKELTERNAAFLKRDAARWKDGKVDMFKPDGEFAK